MSFRAVLTILLFIWSNAAHAQNLWPALFDVTGVASDDVLNIRAEANAESEVIGTLSYDETGVEVIFASDDGKWGAINVGERSGWVRLSFLQRLSGNWIETQAPFAQCFGTEPFWSIRYFEVEESPRFVFKTPDAETAFRFERQLSRNRTDRMTLVLGRSTPFGSIPLMYASLRSEACSDGMSDRVYGLGIDVFHKWSDGSETLSGCCSLSVK